MVEFTYVHPSESSFWGKLLTPLTNAEIAHRCSHWLPACSSWWMHTCSPTHVRKVWFPFLRCCSQWWMLAWAHRLLTHSLITLEEWVIHWDFPPYLYLQVQERRDIGTPGWLIYTTHCTTTVFDGASRALWAPEDQRILSETILVLGNAKAWGGQKVGRVPDNKSKQPAWYLAVNWDA